MCRATPGWQAGRTSSCQRDRILLLLLGLRCHLLRTCHSCRSTNFQLRRKYKSLMSTSVHFGPINIWLGSYLLLTWWINPPRFINIMNSPPLFFFTPFPYLLTLLANTCLPCLGLKLEMRSPSTTVMPHRPSTNSHSRDVSGAIANSKFNPLFLVHPTS